MKIQANRKLNEIAQFLIAYDIDQLQKIGIKYGKLGVALFLINYYKYSKKNIYLEKANSIINRVINDILTDNISNERRIGNIVDFGKFIQHIRFHGFLDEDPNSILQSLDSVLGAEQDKLLREGDFDVAEGALGIAYYFLSRLPEKEAEVHLHSFLEGILKLALTDQGGAFWKSTMFDGTRVYLGLHGSASIIIFLLKLARHFDFTREQNHLLAEAARFLGNNTLSQERCIFPIVVGSPIKRVPLEWAYGDLLPSLALLRYCRHFKDNGHLKRIALNACALASQRIFEEEIVADGGISHGISGTAIVLDHIYELTSDLEILKARNDCYYRLLTEYANKGSYVGFKAKYDIDIPGADVSFLSGISGIGLSLLSFLQSETTNYHEFIYL